MILLTTLVLKFSSFHESYRIKRREGVQGNCAIVYIFEIWTLFVFMDSIYFIIGLVFGMKREVPFERQKNINFGDLE